MGIGLSKHIVHIINEQNFLLSRDSLPGHWPESWWKSSIELARKLSGGLPSFFRSVDSWCCGSCGAARPEVLWLWPVGMPWSIVHMRTRDALRGGGGRSVRLFGLLWPSAPLPSSSGRLSKPR